MKFILAAVLLLHNATFSQKPPEGYFTTEASAVVLGENLIVSIKKYNPTADEIRQAKMPRKGEPMNYLQAPAMSINIEMVNKGFESKLYSLDKDGNIAWEKTLGWSNKSVPSPITESGGYIFTGECQKEDDLVIIRKIDGTGKQLWEAAIDSLHNVNAILVENNKVNVLVSFDASDEVKTGDNVAYITYPVYFFVQLDPATGKFIKKEYQAMGNYLSSKGFSRPIISTDYAYYLHNRDSAAFLSVQDQKSAIIVTRDMSKDNQILALTAGPESYHYLTVSEEKGKPVLSMNSDFYVKTKKYRSELPVMPSKSARYFLNKQGDSVITVIYSAKKTSIIYTNAENSKLLHEVVVSNPIAATALNGQAVCLVQVEGRDEPGRIGRIILSKYALK